MQLKSTQKKKQRRRTAATQLSAQYSYMENTAVGALLLRRRNQQR